MRELRIEVGQKPDLHDARGAAVAAQARAAGIAVEGVAVHDLYFLRGDLDDAAVARITASLLVDGVEQQVTDRSGARIEVAPLPGVTDSAGENLLAAAHALGVRGLDHAGTGRAYVVDGLEDLAALAQLLANPVVEAVSTSGPVQPPFALGSAADRTVERVPIRGLDDAGLLALSGARRLSMDVHEMRAVQAHFRGLNRDPTDAELEMLAQTWSEHCVHKTFKARITYREDGGLPEVIDGIYPQYIKAATEVLDSDWLESVFVDNAGIVGFGDGLSLAFKVETHNHPSAIDPFGGANTGVGGVIRDVLGVSARPIAVTDVLLFGPPDLPADQLPDGVIPPRQIAAGVVAGVGDYGNKMGIPTVDGAVLYDPGYTANPLVYCGCLGVLPTGGHPTAPQVGDRVVVIGGRTGRDGLRGATFSSMEMDVDTATIAGTAVQIGHPINEKQVLEVVIAARDAGLYTAITDCGAGGLSSAVGEMGETLGARIELAQVPTKYPGLRPWELWLSEAQERMVLAVPPAQLPALAALCEIHGVDWADLGEFTGDGRMDLRFGDLRVVDLAMDFLHDGIPQRALDATWTTPTAVALPDLSGVDIAADLLALLATPNIRSKEDIVRTYDHEVQGGTVGKPFVGPQQQGPGDAAVLRPFDAGLGSRRGVALSVGIDPYHQDPYVMAWAAVDEAVRNAVAVGADPDQIAILDNFCWGNPARPETLGGLVRCAKGCYDAAIAFRAPFISGKDSLNNEYTGADGVRRAIPGTLLVSALGIVPDIHRAPTTDFKAPGDLIYVLGTTDAAIGDSAWARMTGRDGPRPRPNPDALDTARALHRAIAAGTVSACHDCADGGLAVALAEMAIGGALGCAIDLAGVPGAAHLPAPAVAFSETLTRWVVTVSPTQKSAFEACLQGQPLAVVGQVDAMPTVVLGWREDALAQLPIDALHGAWRGHLR